MKETLKSPIFHFYTGYYSPQKLRKITRALKRLFLLVQIHQFVFNFCSKYLQHKAEYKTFQEMLFTLRRQTDNLLEFSIVARKNCFPGANNRANNSLLISMQKKQTDKYKRVNKEQKKRRG